MSDDAAVGDDPARLAADASGGSPDKSGRDESDASGSSADEEDTGLFAAFFESEPDVDPATVDAPRWLAECMVGGRKLIHGLGLDTGDATDGTPAIAHFANAAYIKFHERRQKATAAGGDESDDTDESSEGGVTIVEQ